MLREKSGKAGLKTVGAIFSPLGIALWYFLAGSLDLLVREELREENILQSAEDYLLLIPGILSVLAALLLIFISLRSSQSALIAVMMLGFAAVFIEIAAITVSPQQEMTASLSWALRAALFVHVCLALSVYGRCLMPAIAEVYCNSEQA